MPFEKGKRHAGRAKGTPNVATKVLKHAIILAGEKSKHSKDGTLLSYIIYIADEYPRCTWVDRSVDPNNTSQSQNGFRATAAIDERYDAAGNDF